MKGWEIVNNSKDLKDFSLKEPSREAYSKLAGKAIKQSDVHN